MFGRFGSGLQRSNPFSRHATLSDSEIKGLEIQSTLVGHTYSVDSLTFGADDGLLISTGYDGVLFWDTSSGKIRSRLADTENSNGGLAISADKKVLATSKGKTVQVWELPSGTLKQTFERTNVESHIRHRHAKGRSGDRGSDDKTIRLWRAAPK